MTSPQIRCLLAVLALSEVYEHIESKDVAHLLGIKKPTAHRTLALLKEKGFIDKKRYGDVHLTETGQQLARQLETQRDNISMLFAKRYGLSPEESTKAAALLLGGLTEESLKKLRLDACSNAK